MFGKKRLYICLPIIIFSASIFFPAVGREQSYPPEYYGYEHIDNNKNNIIFIGDTQRTAYWEFWREHNAKKTELLFEEIAQRDPAFLVILGDLTCQGSSVKQWEYFDGYNKKIRNNKIPLFPVLGNHEYYGNDKIALLHFNSRFFYLEGNTWYSFIYKKIGFIMLNSNFNKLSQSDILAQNIWFNNKLKALENNQDIKRIIVCCHHPPFTNSKVIKPNKLVRDNFVTPFLKFNKTYFFLSGHNHSFEYFMVKNKIFIVTGGGGGARFRVNANKEAQKFKDKYNGLSIRFFHFCELVIHKDTLEMKIIKLMPDNSFKKLLSIQN